MFSSSRPAAFALAQHSCLFTFPHACPGRLGVARNGAQPQGERPGRGLGDWPTCQLLGTALHFQRGTGRCSPLRAAPDSLWLEGILGKSPDPGPGEGHRHWELSRPLRIGFAARGEAVSGSPRPASWPGLEAGVECQASCGPGRDSREKRAPGTCAEGGWGQSITLAMINAAWALHGAATAPAPACCTQGSAAGPKDSPRDACRSFPA